MSICLFMSSNSLRNTTFECDSLGIHYEVAETDYVVDDNLGDQDDDDDEKQGERENEEETEVKMVTKKKGRKKSVRVSKWDRNLDRLVPVGEFRLPYLPLNGKGDIVRMHTRSGGDSSSVGGSGGGSGVWVQRGKMLIKEGNRRFSTARTFLGVQGERYRWKERGTKLLMCHASKAGAEEGETQEDKEPALVIYHRHYLAGHQRSYLEICDTSVLPSLDLIVVTFLIMEKKRRDRD
ncbi:hypothetical protein FRB91_004920 [Serendipita sp. 411]|nr:hypothetical protein FRB91_004920 [Serendipita sp. 411]